MSLLVVGVGPPTDIERRVRELQGELYSQRDLPEGLALPVLIPLKVEGEPRAAPLPRRPAGRLEAPRLVTGAFAARGRWLLWVLQPEPGLAALAGLWSGEREEVSSRKRAESLLPLVAGFPLAWSRSPGSLQAARRLLGPEPPRTFQPRSLTLYRLSALRGEEAPSAATRGSSGAPELGTWDWAQVFTVGVFWEELWSCPLRRRASRDQA